MNLGGLQRLRDQFNDVYALFTNDPEARKARRNAHRQKGAMRSSNEEQEARRLKK